MYVVIVNENMHDADAWIEKEDEAFPLSSGWERVWGHYPTLEDVQVALLEAKDFVHGRMKP